MEWAYTNRFPVTAMHSAYLLLGGNLGNRAALLAGARRHLSALGSIVAQSAEMQTPPWGFDHSVPDFLNQVICLQTRLAPQELLVRLQQIETLLGRVRNQDADAQTCRQEHRVYESRLMDIDILLYDNVSYHSTTLDIPHPKLSQRPFAMELLTQIFPKTLSLKDFIENDIVSYDTRRII